MVSPEFHRIVAGRRTGNRLVRFQGVTPRKESGTVFLIAVRERKGPLAEAEVLEEIPRLHEQGPKAP